MEYEERFTDAELGTVIEQAAIYMCSCPGQVAESIRKLRALYRYQLTCQATPGNSSAVHGIIEQSAVEAHAVLQHCLEEVIRLEQWDRSSLQMPAELRKRQLQALLADD